MVFCGTSQPNSFMVPAAAVVVVAVAGSFLPPAKARDAATSRSSAIGSLPIFAIPASFFIHILPGVTRVTPIVGM